MKGPAGSGKVHRDWFGLSGFRPGPRFLRTGGLLYLLDEVGSSNDFLRGLGESAPGRLCAWDGWGWRAEAALIHPPVTDQRPGTVVVARHQTSGHGRQGRSWVDCGGLHLSVVVPPHRAVLERGFSVWLGLITAMVLREEFQLDARLKWPNDIVVRGRKIGGILLQRSGPPENRLVVAGLGFNLQTAPGGFPSVLQETATSYLIETGRAVVPGEMAGRLLRRVEKELDLFQAQGWAPFRAALAMLDCLLGKEVRLDGENESRTGRACGIDDAGRLILRTAGGREVFYAGDVHVLASAPGTGVSET